MKKVKETIRLHEEAGLSLRQIANALNISRPAVTNILTKLERVKLHFSRDQGSTR